MFITMCGLLRLINSCSFVHVFSNIDTQETMLQLLLSPLTSFFRHTNVQVT